MTSIISLHNPNVEIHEPDNTIRPEFGGGTTLLAVMALYKLQNLLLQVMKLYSKIVAEQKNTSLGVAMESAKNIKSAGDMQGMSTMLAGAGAITGAVFSVACTMWSSRGLKQTQAEMKSVNNKLSIVDNNLKKLNTPTKNMCVDKGDKLQISEFDRFEASRSPIRYNPRTGRVRFDPKRSQSKGKANADAPEIVTDNDIKTQLKELNKTKFTHEWKDADVRHLNLSRSDMPEFTKLDKALRSEQKILNKRMDSLSNEHNSEVSKANQRGQLGNSGLQGIFQTASGGPQLKKGEHDRDAQFTKAVGEQIESSSRQSEEARNQTLQSANHINQILDQLKAAEKAN